MSISSINTKWNADLYDDKHGFVSKYGEDLVDVLAPQKGERVLDLGCGTGYLADLISKSGATAIGIDSSLDMITKAKAEYPNLEFRVLSATDFHFDDPFDAIFSNAALHWVLDKESAIDCMYTNLKRSGRLVIEMGGKHNVESIITALQKSLTKRGLDKNAATQLWYFPSLSEYTTLLEKRGFRVNYAAHYNRGTELKDSAHGIKDWIKMFGGAYLKGISETVVNEILEEVQTALKPVLFKDGKWIADYKRLRIVATK